MGYKAIRANYEAQSRTVLRVLDAMSAMEKEVLGFLDPLHSLEYSFGGSDLPEELPGQFPTILHLPSRNGASMKSVMFGGALGGHPGGLREHNMGVTIQVLVGPRAAELAHLLIDSEFWLLALDMAYAANSTLNGICRGVEIQSARWGVIGFGPNEYFGWTFEVVVKLQYSMEGEG